MLKFFSIIIISFLIGTQFENILQYFDDVHSRDNFKKYNNRACIEHLGLEEKNLKKLTKCKEQYLGSVYEYKYDFWFNWDVEKLTEKIPLYNEKIKSLNTNEFINKEEYQYVNLSNKDPFSYFDNNLGKKIKFKGSIFRDYNDPDNSVYLHPTIKEDENGSWLFRFDYDYQLLEKKLNLLFSSYLKIKPLTNPVIEDIFFGTITESDFNFIIEDIEFSEIPNDKKFIKESVIFNFIKNRKFYYSDYFMNEYELPNETEIRDILSK